MNRIDQKYRDQILLAVHAHGFAAVLGEIASQIDEVIRMAITDPAPPGVVEALQDARRDVWLAATSRGVMLISPPEPSEPRKLSVY